MSEFDAFWSAYPRRESPAAARREYIHARRLVSAETIMAGLARYIEHCPRERQYIKKPENWLRDGDWANEYDEPQAAPSFDWYRECALLHQGSCGGQFKHAQTMRIAQQKKEQAS